MLKTGPNLCLFWFRRVAAPGPSAPPTPRSTTCAPCKVLGPAARVQALQRGGAGPPRARAAATRPRAWGPGRGSCACRAAMYRREPHAAAPPAAAWGRISTEGLLAGEVCTCTSMQVKRFRSPWVGVVRFMVLHRKPQLRIANEKALVRVLHELVERRRGVVDAENLPHI